MPLANTYENGKKLLSCNYNSYAFNLSKQRAQLLPKLEMKIGKILFQV